MITRPRVFDDEHLPRQLYHREAAVSQLTRAWEPALDGDRSEDVLLHGPSGVGKTALARHTLRRLARECDVQHVHVRSLGLSTAGVVRAVLGDLPGPTPATNTPQEDLCAELRDRVDAPVVVVLDEADGLPATDALSRLLDVPLVSVVVITHDPDDWLARAGDDARRHLAGHELGLDRYGVHELADILEERARLGLAPESVTREQLEVIADEVAGVAREGIQSLRAAAELAGERGHRRIGDDDVQDGFERARHAIRESNLQSLPFHHQVLYAIIHEADAISASTLHERYEQISEAIYRGRDQTPITKRSRRYKLEKLVEYDLVSVDGPPQTRTYSATDGNICPAIDLTPHLRETV